MVGKHSITDGNNAAPVKRQRVSRACDQCRATREKCDGIHPVCHACASSARKCTYTAPTKKRGIPPGYMRTLELTLAWIFENVVGSEASLQGALSQEAIASLISGRDSDGSNRLHKRWRRSAPCKEFERILGSSRSEPSHASDPESGAEDSAQAQNSTTLLSRPLGSLSGPETAKLPSNLWRLLDIYFAYTHTWFPIIEKQDILKLTYTYPKEGAALHAEGAPEYAELWALLAVASAQDQSIALEPPSNPNQSPSVQEIYSTARSLIPDEAGIYSISHVNALLLLVLLNIGSEAWTAAWLFLGRAISIAVDLGLHKVARHMEPNRGKHTILACSLLESLLSAYLERPSRMSSINTTSIGPVAEEGLEEWQPWSGCEGFTSARDSHIFMNRAPNRSLRIFNLLVMLSEKICNPTLPDFSFPDDLRLVESHANTPQHLHLHLLYACANSSVDSAIRLLLDFVKYFGAVAMPSVFSIYTGLLSNRGAPNMDANSAALLNDITFNIVRTWSSTTGRTSILLPDARFLATQPRSMDAMDTSHQPNAFPSMQGSNPIAMMEASDNLSPFLSGTADNQHGNSDTGYPATFEVAMSTPGMSHPGSNASPLLRIDNNSALEHYDSHSSVDFGVLFDELTSLDDGDNADYRPLFMQNLGLAPNVDLSDVFTSDFGWDPLLAAHMQSSQASTDQNRNYLDV